MENLDSSLSNRPVARVDLYAGVHKGLRAFMSDTVARVGRIDAEDPEDVGACLAQVKTLLHCCRVHLEDENRFLHTAIDARQPGSAAKIALEHVHHEESIARLEALVSAVEEADDKTRAVEVLYRSIALFLAENLEHMQYEETHHNAVLWASYSDDELRAIEHALVSSIPPETMAIFLAWMLPAMSHRERLEMLAGMREGAPPEAFAGVIAMLREKLPSRDFAKLASALGLTMAA